jgi:flagellar hook assembly protein FlgD
LNLASVDGTFSSTEPIFSPDNDGLQDVILFTYELAEIGHIADLKIYDDKGRLVRKLVQSELLGTTGVFSWNGVRDDDLKAPIGVYIAVFETFKSDGSAQLSKRAVFTLAGKI